MPTLAQKVPSQAWAAFQALVADRRAAPAFAEGQRRSERLIAEYQGTFPEACRCLADDAEASLNHLQVPLRHRQYVRTSNLAKRAFEEERHRTKVIPHLWDEASLVKLVFAVLIRVSERWGKKQYGEFEQHQIRALRQALALDQVLETPALVTMAAQPRRSAASAR
jgi:transposase-like protein